MSTDVAVVGLGYGPAPGARGEPLRPAGHGLRCQHQGRRRSERRAFARRRPLRRRHRRDARRGPRQRRRGRPRRRRRHRHLRADAARTTAAPTSAPSRAAVGTVARHLVRGHAAWYSSPPPTPAPPTRSSGPCSKRPPPGRRPRLPPRRSRPERDRPGQPEVRQCATPRRSSAGRPPPARAGPPRSTGGFRRHASSRPRGTRGVETATLLENTYRHVNIALVNEMAWFCHEPRHRPLGRLSGLAKTKPFGFQAFYPGPGVGGHCIPIDPNYLSRNGAPRASATRSDSSSWRRRSTPPCRRTWSSASRTS